MLASTTSTRPASCLKVRRAFPPARCHASSTLGLCRSRSTSFRRELASRASSASLHGAWGTSTPSPFAISSAPSPGSLRLSGGVRRSSCARRSLACGGCPPTLNFTPETLKPEPYTLNPKPQTPNPTYRAPDMKHQTLPPEPRVCLQVLLLRATRDFRARGVRRAPQR
ncbi:hypothetical protein T484DRAFT_2190097 [Baffinella frigidus]|nr:hypothetical protein T484DRAFT_2190097 [Cryptophyta sp. CCMP2293]